MYGFVREQLSPRRGHHYLQPAEIVSVKEGRPKNFWWNKRNKKQDKEEFGWQQARKQLDESRHWTTYRIDDERGHGMLDDLFCDHLDGGRSSEHAYKRARRKISASPTHSRETHLGSEALAAWHKC